MKYIFYILLLFWSISACREAERVEGLSIMTYNIRYANPNDGKHIWDNRKEIIASQISYYQPDLLGLQEVLKSQLSDIVSLLPQYAYVGVGRDDGKDAGEFAPVFYRKDRFKLLDWGTVWLSETPEKPSIGWDAALPRIFTWVKVQEKSGKKIWYLANAHFDHRGVEAREQSARLMLEKSLELAEGLPIILTGDFNFNQDEGAYTFLAGQELITDTYHAARLRHGPSGTFNGFNYDSEGDRIDYIWTQAGLEIQSYAAISEIWEGILPSDHIPVLIRLQ